MDFSQEKCRRCPAVVLPEYYKHRMRKTFSDFPTGELLALLNEMGVREEQGLLHFHPPCRADYSAEIVVSGNAVWDSISSGVQRMSLDYLARARMNVHAPTYLMDTMCLQGLVGGISEMVSEIARKMSRQLKG